jgi:hypothetical protein
MSDLPVLHLADGDGGDWIKARAPGCSQSVVAASDE